VYVLSDSKGGWVYNTWIDQGEGDPNLLPPYHFGKTAAVILYLLVGAGVLGTWCTVIFDQYFTSPTLFILLHYLKVKAIGTCQTNRRGWPSNQIKAEEHRRGKKVSQPGDAVFVHEVATCCTNTALSWVLTAVKWYDKNEVHILSNCSTDEEVEYEMKQKGQVDAVMTKQPVMRRIYTSNKVGVDVIDQTDAALISNHGSKSTPWHRPHDAYVNTAFNLTFKHYALTITQFGSSAQKAELKSLLHDTTEARWQLIEQLTEDARFGTENPQVSNLNRGAGLKPAPSPGSPTRGATASRKRRRDDSDADSDADPPPPETPASAPRKQVAKHQWSWCTKGRCGLAGCNRECSMGCKTCGVRVCAAGDFACQNAHLRGGAQHKSIRVEVPWLVSE